MQTGKRPALCCRDACSISCADRHRGRLASGAAEAGEARALNATQGSLAGTRACAGALTTATASVTAIHLELPGVIVRPVSTSPFPTQARHAIGEAIPLEVRNDVRSSGDTCVWTTTLVR